MFDGRWVRKGWGVGGNGRAEQNQNKDGSSGTSALPNMGYQVRNEKGADGYL